MNITKVPCLAFIVNAKVATQNNGKIVRVIERFTGGTFDGMLLKTSGHVSWMVESEGSPLAIKLMSGRTIYRQRRPYHDALLREIKSDDESTQTDTPQQLKEPA